MDHTVVAIKMQDHYTPPATPSSRHITPVRQNSSIVNTAVNPSEAAALLTVAEVIDAEGTNPERGLSSTEVIRRLGEYGYNEFNIHDDEPMYIKYLSSFKDPMIGLLMASVIVSCVLKQWDDAISILLAVVIVVSVGFIQEYRSEKSLEQLNRLVPHRCHVIRNGNRMDIMAKELVPGDVIVCTVGDRIPADCRIIHSAELQIDESSLTGETHYASKHKDALDGENGDIAIADRSNIGFMGTLVRNGNGRAIVIGTGERTEFGAVFHMMQEAEDRKTPLQLNMDDLGKKLSIMSFGIIAFITLLGLFHGKNVFDMFTTGVSLAVAAIPEGLPIVVTVTLALGVMRMAKRNAIVKKLPIVESLGSASVICADKTGTLTQNEMTVSLVYSHGSQKTSRLTGVGYVGSGSVETLDGLPISQSTNKDVEKVLEISVLCNNSHISANEVLGQATEGALLVAAMKLSMPDLRDMYERVSEIPFTSASKWMGVCCRRIGDNGQGNHYVKGMLEVILTMCTTFFRDGQKVSLTEEDCDSIMREARKMADDGLRVLAAASGDNLNQLCFAGILGISDPPRPGVDVSIRRLQKSGVTVCMITGDAKETALAIANKLGIYTEGQDGILSGQQLETMSASELESSVGAVRVFFRTSPRHKLTIINAFQRRGAVVAMTGDGVNDAPAMKQADIGIAMGTTGTDVCKEAADMILVDDDFSTILSAVEEGKSIFFNIRNFVRFQLSSSAAAMGTVGLANLLGYSSPLNAMQILWINIIMDGPPAQSLGVEPVDPDVMKRPPRALNEPIITRSLLENVILSALFIIAGTLYVFTKEMGEDSIVSARTTTISFTTFVMFDMFNAMCCRSADKSIFKIGFFTNHALCYAVGGSIVGQLLVIYFPPLQRVFQTEALSISDLLFIITLSSSVFLADELRKMRQGGNVIHHNR
eukprot:CFRG7600T1